MMKDWLAVKLFFMNQFRAKANFKLSNYNNSQTFILCTIYFLRSLLVNARNLSFLFWNTLMRLSKLQNSFLFSNWHKTMKLTENVLRFTGKPSLILLNFVRVVRLVKTTKMEMESKMNTSFNWIQVTKFGAFSSGNHL